MKNGLNISTKMFLNKYKNLYVNGCSFTAGHDLTTENQWPTLLSNAMGIPVAMEAKNGNSLDTIVTCTINQLINFNPADTLVVIGLTWPDRFGLYFNESMVNITPGDLRKDGTKKLEFYDKISTDRRISIPFKYHTGVKELNVFEKIRHIRETTKNFNLVCSSFTNYLENLLVSDSNFYDNRSLHYTTQLVALQSYLKINRYNYVFVMFQDEETLFKNSPLKSSLDFSKILKFRTATNCLEDMKGSHPGEECAKKISSAVYQHFFQNETGS